MYEFTEDYLASKGYLRYEISNYAKPGRESRHNIGYWTRREYLGLGLGASSLIRNIRFQNTASLDEYLSRPFSHLEKTVLDRRAQMEEYMFLGLRMAAGISRVEFAQTFQAPVEAVYGDVLRRLKERDLIRESEGRIFLTKRGTDVSNQVLAEFLL